jgi:hypothetical protein
LYQRYAEKTDVSWPPILNEANNKGPDQCYNLQEVASTNHTSKLLISNKHNVMIGFADQDVAGEAAQTLMKKLDTMPTIPQDPSGELEIACREACSTGPYQIANLEILGSVVVVNSNVRDWPILRGVFRRFPGGEFYFKKDHSENKHLAGYGVNSAIFFLEKYFKTIEHPTVDELVVLAGHVICSAAEVGRERIDGLQIAVCRPPRLPQFVPIGTLNEIRARSASVLKKIERDLLKPLTKPIP